MRNGAGILGDLTSPGNKARKALKIGWTTIEYPLSQEYVSGGFQTVVRE